MLKTLLFILIILGASVSTKFAASAQISPNEGKVNVLLDIILTNKMSLAEDCSDLKKKVSSSGGEFQVGDMSCKTDGIKVYLGSAEIEYKLINCQKNGVDIADRAYVFGAVSESEFRLIDEAEKAQPLYQC